MYLKHVLIGGGVYNTNSHMIGGNVGTVDDSLGCFFCVEGDTVAIDTAGSLTLSLQLFVLLIVAMTLLFKPPPPATTLTPVTGAAALSSSGRSWLTNSKKSRKKVYETTMIVVTTRISTANEREMYHWYNKKAYLQYESVWNIQFP